jgi:hypothetical protein
MPSIFSIARTSTLAGACAFAACAQVSPSTPSVAGASAVQAPAMAGLSAQGYRPMLGPGGAMSVLPEGFRPNAVRPAWMKPPPPGAAGQHVAVAQFGASSVLWYPAEDKKNAPPSVCEPASSTNGIRADRDGNLWVPDGRADSTTEYAPNCGAALLTIPDPSGEPADVGFDKHDNVYILNLNNHSGAPTVNAYNRQGALLRTLSDPSFNILFGIGTDTNGDVFVSNLTTSNVGNVVEFPRGRMPGSALAGVALGLPGSPVFDKANNLIISDWLAETIDVFAPPYTGAPATTPLMGSSIWCPLSKQQNLILCGDADNGSIDVYAYPGGTYRYSYTSGLSASALVTGVAPSPPAAF